MKGRSRERKGRGLRGTLSPFGSLVALIESVWKENIVTTLQLLNTETDAFFFLISNKILLKRKKSHPCTQGVYKGEQIKNENYKSQENPKEIKKGFSKQRTIQVRFGKREA